MNAETIDLLIRRELPAAARGDRDAYGRIVAASQNAVTSVALAITRDVSTSEDIAQDAFLSAWRHLRKLNNPDSFLPWLRQITRNLARDHLRGLQRGPRPVDDADAAIAAAADAAPTPMQQLIEDEQQRAAAELISALPEDSREVLLLFYREGQSSRQVAELLGLSDAAVRKRLSRARQLVREDLLKRFSDFAGSTAPGAAFTVIVTTALTIASPPAAAAGVFGIASILAGKTAGKVLLGAAGSIGIGILAGFAGIFFGLRQQLKHSIDQRERRELTRSAMISAGASVGFVVALVVVAKTTTTWHLAVLATLLFIATVFYQTIVVQRRVLSRRHALEARRDPVAAAKRRKRERLMCWVGGIVGFVTGLGGLLVGLIQSGRL
ncbi:MAG: sigma-70 family RNA polymerase sigma factor [Pseudomonadota bacterium]|nr:sigma-70 family RNA polymerase sigma factor [Pseudomonadota bacterium]